jgi:ubiquitin carboxyl-terminal hydrolase 25/28
MGQAIDVECLTILEDEAVSADTELDTLKRRIADIEKEIEDLWKDATVATYELASVFMHRGMCINFLGKSTGKANLPYIMPPGEANFGHYYLLQRALPGQADRWLKFNDEQVTDVDASEVFADTTGSTANPYWLSYVRTGQETVIDAIRRELDA